MIRPATLDDLHDLIALAATFFCEHPISRHVTFSAADVSTAAAACIENPDALILVGEKDGQVVGVIALIVTPCFYNTRALAATEVMWFIHPAHRGGSMAFRLLQAAEEWAESRGAVFLAMVAHSYNPSVSSIYERRGYLPYEISYLKAF